MFAQLHLIHIHTFLCLLSLPVYTSIVQSSVYAHLMNASKIFSSLEASFLFSYKMRHYIQLQVADCVWCCCTAVYRCTKD